jgi:endonuclease G
MIKESKVKTGIRDLGSLAFVLIAACVSAGCATTTERTRTAMVTAHIFLQGGFTEDQQTLANHSCYEGLPQKTSENLGPTELVFRQGYVLEHSSTDKIPLWVCENIGADQLGGPFKREGKFAADPALTGPKATPADYTNTGYDRGHQAPAGNQTADKELNIQTFYMSNMAPQTKTLNEGIWKKLEDTTRRWVMQYGRAYEWTGPIFYDPKEDNSGTADGTVTFKTIGKDGVAVPTHFYKIVVVKDNDQWKSIAFVIPNQEFKSPYHPENYRQSIEWIEQHTGIKFMPDLSAQQRAQLEPQVSEMWP